MRNTLTFLLASVICHTAHAATINVQPIRVCDDDGNNCAQVNTYTDYTNKIYAQSGDMVNFLPIKQFNSTKHLTIENSAERFELYVCGVELANAFSELTDVAIQRERFRIEMDEKERLYSERYPVDEDFIEALGKGLPPSGGIALGVDRLVMLATGAEDIEQVLWTPIH